MKKECLKLVPTKYFSPWSGKWKDYTYEESLGEFDSIISSIKLERRSTFRTEKSFFVYFLNNKVYYGEKGLLIADVFWEKVIPLYKLLEIGDARVCAYDENDKIQIGFEFKTEDYNKIYLGKAMEEIERRTQSLKAQEGWLEQWKKGLDERERLLHVHESELAQEKRKLDERERLLQLHENELAQREKQLEENEKDMHVKEAEKKDETSVMPKVISFFERRFMRIL